MRPQEDECCTKLVASARVCVCVCGGGEHIGGRGQVGGGGAGSI